MIADTFIVCFLAAFSVGLGAWSIANIVIDLTSGDRRRLKKRLATTRADSDDVSDSRGIGERGIFPGRGEKFACRCPGIRQSRKFL